MDFALMPSVEYKGDWIARFAGVDCAEYKFANLSRHEAVFNSSNTAARPDSLGFTTVTAVMWLPVQDLDATVERILAAGGMLVGRITESAAGFRPPFLRDLWRAHRAR
ncbi:hypothetical protein [Bradyrhizobium sp. BWA-3-5]|uniref:hypothetical protein n=1 Tax=Bradyrhizobium sp. BWA-3-5 TaxID=3080013 RepID=UPI00293E4307|nr:hypothetical protein [Bradyrhizobium sp. BWA-3-5]WOH63929.1 hypothetical protein RX331_25200 [Bradyrhizobium sp. BWA-3-5]